MGVSTRRVKRIVQNADMRRSSRGLVIATSDSEPELAVLYEDTDPPVVVTVLFRTADEYVREGKTFRTVHSDSHMVD